MYSTFPFHFGELLLRLTTLHSFDELYTPSQGKCTTPPRMNYPKSTNRHSTSDYITSYLHWAAFHFGFYCTLYTYSTLQYPLLKFPTFLHLQYSLTSYQRSYVVLQGFMTDCPDGRMNKDKMKEMFNAVAPSVGPDSTFKLKGQCYEIPPPPIFLSLNKCTWALT